MSGMSHLTCQDVFERLNDFLDRELSPEDCDRVEEHLARCADCTRQYRFEAGVVESLKAKLHRIVCPPDVMQRVLSRLAEFRGPGGDQANP